MDASEYSSTGNLFSNRGNFGVAAVRFSLKTPNVVYAGVGTQWGGTGFLRSDNAGDTWTMASSVPNFIGGNDPAPLNDQHPRSVGNLIALDPTQANEYIYVGTFSKGVMRSSNGGSTWQTISLPGVSAPYVRGLAMDDQDPQTIYVACYDTEADGVNESIFKITNARTATTAERLDAPFLIAEELVVCNGTLYIAASTDGVWKYDGAFTQLYSDTKPSLFYSIDGYWDSALGQAVVYASTANNAKNVVGSGYLRYSVIRTKDSGANWTCLTADETKLYGGTGMPMGDATGDIWWHSINDTSAILGGGTFVACQTLIDPSDPTHKRVYVAGRAGCWRSDDAFSVDNPDWYPTMRHINATINKEVVADQRDGSRVYNTDVDWTVQYSTDQMDHVRQKATGLGNGEEWALAVDNSTGLTGGVYLGRGTAMAYSADPPSTGWVDCKVPSAGQNVKGVAAKNVPGIGTVTLAAVQGKGIWRKIGAGATGTWTQVFTGNGVTQNLGSVDNTCFAWGGGSSQMVYFTDRVNGVYRSLNGGSSWTSISTAIRGSGANLAYCGSVAIDPTNDANALITQTTGVWTSSNANAQPATFTKITLPTINGAAAGPASCAVFDDQGNAYINTIISGTTPPAVFFRAAGDTVWYNIATDATFRSQAGFAYCMSVGPAPDHKIYISANGTGITVGSQADTSAPVITNLSATPDATQITLSWTNPAPANFDVVRVVRTTDAPASSPDAGTVVYEGKGTSVVDSGLSTGVTYYYSAFARNLIGTWSPAVSISAKTIDITPPGPVTGVTATPGDLKITLAWTNPADDDFAGIQIQRKTNAFPNTPSDGWTLYNDGPRTTITNAGIYNGVTYYYTIWAKDSSGNYSTPVKIKSSPADTIAPGSVMNFAAVAGDEQISLSWRNPGDSDLQAVSIIQSTDHYPTSVTDGEEIYSGKGTSFTKTGLTNDTVYYYAAFAEDEVPNYSDAVVAQATPKDVTAPASVSNFVAVPGDEEVSLSWSNPADSDFAGVILVVRFDMSYPAGPYDGVVVYNGTGSSVVDKNVENGVTYYYAIFAYDEVPNYSPAAEAAATPADTTAPAAPANFQAISGDEQIALSWSNPADDDFAGVNVVRKADGFPTSMDDGVVVYSGTGTSLLDVNLRNNESYYYAIFAKDEVPNLSASALSSAIPADVTAPAAVSDFAAASGDEQVLLSWKNPADTDLASVIVVRGEGMPPVSPDEGVTIYAGKGESACDNGLTNGVEYFYAIFALDEVPNYSVAAVASATPADVTAPGAVDSFTAVSGDKEINLLWNNPADGDFAGVVVLRKTDGYPADASDGTIVYSGTEAMVTDTNLQNGVKYFYAAFAKDEVPNWSAAAQASATPADVTPPAVVSNFIATPALGQVTLQWTLPTDKDLAGVTIVRSQTGVPASITDGTVVYNGMGTSLVQTGLSASSLYYYAAFSYDREATPNVSEAATVIGQPYAEATFKSIAAEDGWILEAQAGGVGQSVNATASSTWALRVGDQTENKQVKAVVSFDTSSLPDGCLIAAAELKLRRGGVPNKNPFGLLGVCDVDIASGKLGATTALEPSDFEAPASFAKVAQMSNPQADGDWSTGIINSTGLAGVDSTGKTQMRVYLTRPDNADRTKDIMGFWSGEAASADQPQLTVLYQPNLK